MLGCEELEKLFNSKDENVVFKFYDAFKNTEELLEFVKKRPHNQPKIHEIEGNKEIIVVAPTKFYDSKLAKDLIRVQGFHIILAESGQDPFFNYAKNTNAGVMHALKYSPKWIIVTNDDMYKIDNPEILREKLKAIDNKSVDNVWINPNPEHHHSREAYLYRIQPQLKLARQFQGSFNVKTQEILDKFGVNYILLYGEMKWHYRPLIKVIRKFRATEDFFIISGNLLAEWHRKGEKMYDETFLNGAEDAWLSLKVQDRTEYIDFKIGSMIGTTHGMSKSMDARGIIAKIIFDYKLKEAKMV